MAKLLVVDDEVGIRELLSEILSDEGHAVTAAGNAEEARQALAAGAFDLILLDIWMPDTDGVTFLKELSSKHGLACPVIMMSGHATIDTAVEATKFGACDFLEKPISMKRLLSAVSAGLQAGAASRGEAMIGVPAKKAAPDGKGPRADIYSGEAKLIGSIPFSKPLREARDEFEKRYLQVLLEEENYAIARVAARSGLERTHLYRKIKQLEIALPPKTKAAA